MKPRGSVRCQVETYVLEKIILKFDWARQDLNRVKYFVNTNKTFPAPSILIPTIYVKNMTYLDTYSITTLYDNYDMYDV